MASMDVVLRGEIWIPENVTSSNDVVSGAPPRVFSEMMMAAIVESFDCTAMTVEFIMLRSELARLRMGPPVRTNLLKMLCESSMSEEMIVSKSVFGATPLATDSPTI